MISISIVIPASTNLRERGMDMETYRQMQARHQKEMNDFPIAFAYDEKQFNDGMNKLGLDPSETDKVVSVFYGAFIRKEDHPALMEMFERHTREERDAFVRNEDDWAYHAFRYELANHEFSYTGDYEPALEACGFTLEELKQYPDLVVSFRRAMRDGANNDDEE